MTNWISSFTPTTTTRTDALAWVGHKFTVGASPITVSSLGRWVIAGSAGASHAVKLVNAATGVDVPGGSVTINTSGATAGAFKYVALASPITLSASTAYYLVCAEAGGGELWLSFDSTMTVTAVAVANGTVYNTSTSGGTWNEGATAGQSYVGLDFQYSAAADTTPPTFTSASVNGATLVAITSEAVDTAFVPTTSAYIVTVAGSPRTVTNVTVVSGSVTLALASPVTAGQTVTLGYSP
jgi:uncharacterized repeat protein (TIGR02059 family)